MATRLLLDCEAKTREECGHVRSFHSSHPFFRSFCRVIASPSLQELLRTFRPQTLYSLVPAKVLQQAAVQFGQDWVKHFYWRERGEMLTAEVGGAQKIHEVQFTRRKSELEGACGCGAVLQEPCLHLTVALMTVLRVVHGTKFHVKDLSGERLEQLRQQLLSETATGERIAGKVIFVQDNPGQYRIDYESALPGPSWLLLGAPAGMEWLEWQSEAPMDVGDAFFAWLEEGQNGVQLEIQPPPAGTTGLFPLDQVQTTIGRVTEQLRLLPDAVELGQMMRAPNGELLEPFIPLGYGMAFCPEQGVFARLIPADAQCAPRQKLGLEAFNRRRLPAGEHRHPFDLSGRPAEPEEVDLRPGLMAETGEKEVRLRLRLLLPDERMAPVHRAVSQFLRDLVEEHAELCDAPARRRRLFQGLGQLLNAPERSDLLKTEIAQDPIFDEERHQRAARRFLDHLLKRLAALDEPFLFAAPNDAAPWRSCRKAGQGIGRLLVLMNRLFPQSDFLNSTDLEGRVELTAFSRRIGMLAAACEAERMMLRVNEAPVQREQLTLTLEFEETGEVDWFELHPNVQAGAFRLPPERWHEILRSGMYETDDGSFVVVDEESIEALADFSEQMEWKRKVHRLHLFDWLAMREDGVECALPPEEEVALTALTRLGGIPSLPQPAGIQAELRSYQRSGYEWLGFLYRHRFGACLADDMGLGKTLQTITFLLGVHEGILPPPSLPGPALIVLPPTLVFNWRQELQRFAPNLRLLEYVGARRYLSFANVDVILTTYDIVRRDQDLLAEKTFGIAIFDEAQAIKNLASHRAQAVARLRTGFRLCLTGTPLENHYREFHSIMEAAVPGLFGAADPDPAEAPPPHLLARAKPFLLRRTKQKILTELPPKVESDIWMDLADTQKECYTRAVGAVRQEILEAYREKPAQQAGIAALAALMRLRQACISPAMLSRELPDDSPKLDLLTEQLTELMEEGHASLVFSHFVTALDLLGARLQRLGIPYLRLDGSVPTGKRRDLVEAFQSGSGPGVFMISTKIGGAGLNLTRASYVYHLDPWWNPAVENQASDRAHRLGQRQSVFIQRLLMRHSVEEKISMLKARKMALFESVVEQGGAAGSNGKAQLGAEDFQFLIT